MNKFLQKLATTLLGFSLAAGVGVAISAGRKDAFRSDAGSYTITFNGSNSESTTISTSTTAASITGSSSFVTGNVAAATKAYGATSNGVKLGTSSASGSIKVNLSSSGQKTPTSIVVSAKRYNTGTNSNLSVNGSDAKSISNSSSFNNYTFSITSAITYLQINASKYAWIKSVTVNFPTPATSVTITGNDGTSLAPGDTRQLGTTVLPVGHTDTITWESSSEGVATVSNTGLVTAVAGGETTITARANQNVAGTTTISVDSNSPYVSVDSTVSGALGTNTSLGFTYANLGGTLTVESSDTDKVTVSNLSYSNGSGSIQVNFVAVGTSTLTFYDGDTSLATCTAKTNNLAYEVEFGTETTDSATTFNYSIPTELSIDFAGSSKVYGSSDTPTSLKFGSSSAVGMLSISLSANAPANTYISGVTIWAKRYNSSGVKMSVTPSGGSTIVTENNIAETTTDYYFDVSSTQVSTITIASVANTDRRLYIEKISIENAYKASLDSISTEGQTSAFTHNSAFDYDGTLTASYTQGKADEVGVTPSTFKYGDNGIDPTSQGIAIEEGDLLTVGTHNGKYIYVGYTETGLTKWTSYQITVTYEALIDNDLTMTQGPINAALSDGSVQLSASVTNAHANPTITWSSGNTDIANVDQTGLVTFVTSGTVVITAAGSNNISKNCQVVISGAASLSLDITSISNKFTGDADVTITPTYTNIPNEATFTWTSSNTNVATVSKGTNNVGIVHFVGTSTQQESVTLTITKNNETVISASCTLDSITKSEVTGIDIDESTYTLYDNQYAHTVQLTATIDDEDVIGNANKNVTWTSSDNSLAIVSSTGLVTAQDGVGGTAQDPVTVTITAASTYTSTTTDTCEITIVHDTVTELSWNGRNTPSGFYTGDILGEKTDWTFDATWASGKKEQGNNAVSWGTGDNQVKIYKYPSSGPIDEPNENLVGQDYEIVASDNNKSLMPFYGGFHPSQAKVLNITQSEVTAISITHARISEGSLSMYDTETLTLEYGVTSVGNVNKGIDWEVSNNAVSFTDQGYDGNGVGHIQVSGTVCENVILTGTSKNDSGVTESITISIDADTVQSLTWSGTSDVLEYESGTATLGSVIDSSCWSFTANWIKKTESDLVVGSGANNVQIGVFDTATPSTYSSENAYDSTDTLDISYNNKYLVAFYKGVASTESIKLKIVQKLKTVNSYSSVEHEFSWVQTASTSDISNSSKSATLGGVSWSKNTQTNTYSMTGLSTKRYLQIGRSQSLEPLELKTSGISGTITKISVDCASGSGNGTISASVGNTVFISSDTTMPTFSSNAGDVVEGTGSASGEITITLTGAGNNSGKGCQVYLHSIEIEYTVSTPTEITNKTDYKVAQYAVVEFAQYMNSQMNGENVCTGNMSNLATAWGKVRDKYNALFVSGDNKLTGAQLERAIAIMQKANANWNEDHDSDEQYCLERALKTYEWCTSHYNATICPRFMDGVRSAGHNPGISPLINIINGQNTNTIAIIVIISMVSVTAIGGYFFLRKRKENN